MPFDRTCSSITSVIGCNILLTTSCIPLSLIHRCILISHFFSAYISLPSSFPGVFRHLQIHTHAHIFSPLPPSFLTYTPLSTVRRNLHKLPPSSFLSVPLLLSASFFKYYLPPFVCPWFVIRIQWKYHLIQSHTPSPQPPTRTSTQHPFLSFQSVIVS